MPYYVNQPQQYQSVVDPYIEGETARQNALIRGNAIERGQMENDEYRGSRGNMNALAQARTQETLSQSRERDIATRVKTFQLLAGPAKQFDTIYEQAKARLGGNEQAAAAEVNQHYQRFRAEQGPMLEASGVNMPAQYDPMQVKLFLSQAEKIDQGGQDYHPVPTAAGYQTFNKQKGTYTPAVDAQGKPLMPVTGDIELITRKKEATDRAAAGVKKEVGFPKARATFSAANRQWDFVGTQIDKAIGQISPFTAGMGAWAAVVPASPQKDLKETLESIKANIGFDKLAEMRANSPTGGALGQVSDFENKLLQAVQGSLQQNQSPGQLKQNLQTVKEMLAQVRDERSAAFEQDYGAISQSRPAQSGSVPRGTSKPLTATNPQTKQRIISRDGGKTWQPL